MRETFVPELDEPTLRRIGRVLRKVPQGLYVLTSTHEARVGAVMVSWVQQASFDPPMVVVALRKGSDIVPLIHESRAFALSQLAPGDKLILKKLAGHADPPTAGPEEPSADAAADAAGDPDAAADDAADADDAAPEPIPQDDNPIQSVKTFRRTTGSPILARAMAYLDCELVRHVDIDGDHDLYAALIHDADVLRDGPPPAGEGRGRFEY